MSQTLRGRHRAASRPSTPLTEIAQAALGRNSQNRLAAVATAGGLMFSTFGAATSQITAAEEAAEAAAAQEEARLAAEAAERAALIAAPGVVEVANWVRTANEASHADGVHHVEATPAPIPEPPRPWVPPASVGSLVVEIAARYVGVPYLWGGTSAAGFDCSGFTQHVFRSAGISIPRTSTMQRNAGTVIPRSAARPGDLIWSPGHVAIYAGNGMQIDSPRPGSSVGFRQIWQSNPTFIRL